MFDYIVVGAGSAGCALASRLSADPAADVLLLEAGPPDRKLEIRVPAAAPKLFKTRYDWDYATAPQPGLAGRELYWPRGKTLGGSSAINYQMYARGNRADFDHWAESGNPGWGFEQVLPYFRRLERYGRGDPRLRGRDGPLCIEDLRDPNPMTRAFVQAAVEAGLPANDDVNGAVQDGVGLTQVTQRRGRRWSAADAYLRPAGRRRNLTVRTRARATRVLFERGRAAGVEYLDLAGRRHKLVTVRAASEVILAAGAVVSPHLLLCSGVGPAEILRGVGVRVVHDLPGVGDNLQDHLAVWVVAASARPVSLTTAESPANLARWLFLRRGMLTSNGGEACAFTRTDPTLPAPDLELIFAPVPYIDHLVQWPAFHGLAIGAAALQPHSRGRVTLASADPLTPPRIQPGYLSDPEGRDLATLACGVTLARRILEMPALAAFAAEMVEPAPGIRGGAEVETFIREQAETIYHPVGTCRMGQDALAVVDPGLRVHGLDGLRIADASVMPAIVRGHTNAATIMIAEKAADLISGGLHAAQAPAAARD
jgi:choline dehydrogenase